MPCHMWMGNAQGKNPTLVNLPNLGGLTLKAHLKVEPWVPVLRIYSSFSRILTLTFLFQNLQDFMNHILTWNLLFMSET
jgi:hypothetical protein